jgi:hypothetical protein
MGPQVQFARAAVISTKRGGLHGREYRNLNMGPKIPLTQRGFTLNFDQNSDIFDSPGHPRSNTGKFNISRVLSSSAIGMSA